MKCLKIKVCRFVDEHRTKSKKRKISLVYKKKMIY